jgi:hypothetical protein
MYCPTCGTKASTNQKFCRRCGMGLLKIFQLVAEHLSEKGLASPMIENKIIVSQPPENNAKDRAGSKEQTLGRS